MRRPFKLELCIFLAICFVWRTVSFRPPSTISRSRCFRDVTFPHKIRTKSSNLYAGGKKNMSSSDRERRDEERRRNERKDDVVIGKTSAKRGESDYVLDPKATEEEYLRQASNVEQEIFYLTEQGMELLNTVCSSFVTDRECIHMMFILTLGYHFIIQFELEDADRAFDKVFELRPNAYLWQAGIVKFYLGNLRDAADIFARNARTYESKFGCQATEERIWRDACELKFLNLLPRKERKDLTKGQDVSSLIKSIPDFKSDDILSMESRRVLKVTQNLFSATVGSDKSEEILTRAKLRSLCGEDNTKTPITPDRKMWKLNAWFYLGLHFDVIGETQESQNCMKMALKLCPSIGKSKDIIHTLPLLHMSTRDWFDDADFDDDPMTQDQKSNELDFAPPQSTLPIYASADPVVEESIRKGVAKMKLTELKDALRLRNLNTIGSKQALQERLFYSLMDDAGFQSGFAP